MSRSEFSLLIEKESHPLRNYAYQLTRNVEDANDLLQETLLKAFTYHNKFLEGTNLKAWLYTIMRNSFINNYRRLVRKHMLIDSGENAYLVDSCGQTAENMGEIKFLKKDIELAIGTLPVDLRKTFTMNIKGFKYHEIADILNIPLGTVKTRIFISKRILRKRLVNYSEFYSGKAVG